MNLILICLRLYLLTGSCLASAFFLFTRILKPRRGYGLLTAFIVLKVFWVDFFATYLLPTLYQDRGWMPGVKTAVVLLFAISVYFVLYASVEAGFLRTAIVAMLCEVLSILPHYCGFGLLNLLEGQTVWARGEFVWLDLLYPLVTACVASLLWNLTGHGLQKLRTCPLRLPGLLWLLFLCYICAGIMTNISTTTQDFGIPSWIVLVTFLFFFLLLISVAVISRRNVQAEQQSLQMQERFARTHYEILQSQLTNIGPILEQMSRHLAQIDDRSGFTPQAREYLAALKLEFQKLTAGVYCKDWETDAILCARAEQYAALGIPWDFYFQTYDRSPESSADILRILLLLTEAGLDSQGFSLHTSMRKERLILQFRAVGIRKRTFPRRELLRILRRRGGTCYLTSDSSSLCGILTLEQTDVFEKNDR